MRIVLIVVAVLAAGCGGTSTVGAACSTPDAIECSGARSMLVCEGGRWTGYPCPSCAANTCDWKGAANGAACPKVAETYGTCTLDGRLVGCYWSASANAGVFIESACSACVAGKSIEELGKCSSGRCSCQ